MASREGYRISGNTVEELKLSLQFFMQSIADRMDKIEGVRGGSKIESDLNLSGNNLVDVGNFDQNLGTDDSPQFGGLTIDGDVTLTGTQDANIYTVTDANSTIIHQLGDS